MNEKQPEGWFDLAIAACAALLAILVVAAYWGAFRDHHLGGPSEWGQFGDYVGGILNPVIGLATALLLIRSLRAAQSNNHTAGVQLELAQRQHQIDLHTRRLDVALTAWERALEEPYSGIIGLDLALEQASGLGTVIAEERSLRSILSDRVSANFATNLRDAGRYQSTRWEWVRSFNAAANILIEISEYCDQLDTLHPHRFLSLPYRRRVSTPAMVMRAMQQISEEVHGKLMAPQFLGDIGRRIPRDQVEKHIEEQLKVLTAECVKDVDEAVEKAPRGAMSHDPQFQDVLKKWPHQEPYLFMRLMNRKFDI